MMLPITQSTCFTATARVGFPHGAVARYPRLRGLLSSERSRSRPQPIAHGENEVRSTETFGRAHFTSRRFRSLSRSWNLHQRPTKNRDGAQAGMRSIPWAAALVGNASCAYRRQFLQQRAEQSPLGNGERELRRPNAPRNPSAWNTNQHKQTLRGSSAVNSLQGAGGRVHESAGRRVQCAQIQHSADYARSHLEALSRLADASAGCAL